MFVFPSKREGDEPDYFVAWFSVILCFSEFIFVWIQLLNCVEHLRKALMSVCLLYKYIIYIYIPS
jgi:hypothetical protein